MTYINIGNLHHKLAAAGIPIDGIALNRPNKPGISIDFMVEATDEQKASAQTIVDAYDQDSEDAAKAISLSPVTADDINATKTVPDLKALLIRMLSEKV